MFFLQSELSLVICGGKLLLFYGIGVVPKMKTVKMHRLLTSVDKSVYFVGIVDEK